MKCFRSRLAAVSIAIAMAAVFCIFAAPDGFAAVSVPHGSGQVWLDHLAVASPALLALRTEHTELTAKITAKFKEMKDGLAADVIARIEREHADLVAQAKDVADKITAEELKEGAVIKLKSWSTAFYASAETSGLTLAALNKIVADSATHDAAKDALIDAMATAGNGDKPGATGARAQVGAEATEKFVTGATKAIIAKVSMFNVGGKPDKDGERNEFTGMSLRELARAYLETRGIRNISHDSMTMIGNAMQPVVMNGALSTSDFVNILANVANKAMLKGYEESAETFDKWTGKGTLTDFKTASRVDLGLFPSLTKVVEGAEYSYASVSDRGVSLVLATYGKLFPITRQAMINDDLGAFTKVPSKMGAAAKRTIADLVYAILTSNPTMPDNVALFHATHKNLLTGAGSALSADSLDAGRVALGLQTDPDNIKKSLNIRPKYWIGPITLEGKARQIFASQSEPGQTNPAVANRVAGMAEVISEGRLDIASTTAWYLAGDPSQVDTIEVDYLNGVEAPTLEQKDGWNVDGVEMKVRMDAGVTPLDFRALQKSVGA